MMKFIVRFVWNFVHLFLKLMRQKCIIIYKMIQIYRMAFGILWFRYHLSFVLL